MSIKNHTHPTSILDASAVHWMLQRAKMQMQHEGTVMPLLFLQMATGEQYVHPLALPATADERRAYLAALGTAIRHRHQRLQEAALLAGGWIVRAKDGGEINLALPPSQHPARQEAITIVGRNAGRTRVVSAIQPLWRRTDNELVWEPLEMTGSEGALRPGSLPVGLVDFLFTNETARPTS